MRIYFTIALLLIAYSAIACARVESLSGIIFNFVGFMAVLFLFVYYERRVRP